MSLRHPLYSRDLAPTIIFFRNLDKYLQGKPLSFRETVETEFQDFVDSRSPLFYYKGINILSGGWWKMAHASGFRNFTRHFKSGQIDFQDKSAS